jgi:PhnB protein
MSSVSTYLNFKNQTEEAFLFYKKVFKTEFSSPMMRFKDIPQTPNENGECGHVSESDGNLVMHIALPILGGHQLMGTDAPESMGFKLIEGNNVYINLEPDSKEETDRLFNELAEGGVIEMPLQVMFWGDYYGSLCDKFGIRWMFNYSTRER